MLLILAFVMLSVCTLLINALLRHTMRVSFVLGLFVVAFAQVVAVSQLASLFSAIQLPFFLSAHLVTAGAALWLWRRAAYPHLLGPFAGGRWRIWREWAAWKSAPALWLLSVGSGLAYLLNALVIPRVPPNNYDSLTYHISRVGYWLQRGSLFPWWTPNARQASYPINTELGLLWMALFGGGEAVFGYLQWLSAAVCGVAIFGIARLMKANRTQSLFAALMWLLFPQILLQSTTTQNDLVTAALFAVFIYFLFVGLRRTDGAALGLAGAAFGMAVGAKSTVVLILPGVVVGLLVIWWRNGRKGLRRLLAWGVAASLGFGLLGAFGYVQNALFYGDALNVTELSGGAGLAAPVPRSQIFISNTFLYLYQFADLTGLPPQVAAPLSELKVRAAQKLVRTFNLPVENGMGNAQFSLNQALRSQPSAFEDTSWFGLSGCVMLLVVFFWQGWVGLRRKDEWKLALILMAAGLWLAASFTLGWTPYKGRYFILSTSVLAPLMAFLYPVKPRWFVQVLVWAAVLAALGIGGYTLATNGAKPLVGVNAIWNRDAVSLRTLNFPVMKPVIQMVEAHVPPDAVLATRLGGDDWDGVLFGAGFQRSILQADPFTTQLDLPALRQAGAQFLLTSPFERPFLSIPAGLGFVAEENGWMLFSLTAAAPGVMPAGAVEVLGGSSAANNLVSVAPALAGKVGVIAASTGQWEAEPYQGQTVLWLGEYGLQGLRLTLFSEQEQTVTLSFEIQPGPGREDLERHIGFSYTPRNSYRRQMENSVREVRTIQGAARLEFTLQLQRGHSDVAIRVLDQATVLKHPNGDERPLLALLSQVTISPRP